MGCVLDVMCVRCDMIRVRCDMICIRCVMIHIRHGMPVLCLRK